MGSLFSKYSQKVHTNDVNTRCQKCHHIITIKEEQNKDDSIIEIKEDRISLFCNNCKYRL